MIYYTDECCGCATESYPCLGSACSLRHVAHYVCDRCGEEIYDDDNVYELFGDRCLCHDCAVKEGLIDDDE